MQIRSGFKKYSYSLIFSATVRNTISCGRCFFKQRFCWKLFYTSLCFFCRFADSHLGFYWPHWKRNIQGQREHFVDIWWCDTESYAEEMLKIRLQTSVDFWRYPSNFCGQFINVCPQTKLCLLQAKSLPKMS